MTSRLIVALFVLLLALYCESATQEAMKDSNFGSFINLEDSASQALGNNGSPSYASKDRVSLPKPLKVDLRKHETLIEVHSKEESSSSPSQTLSRLLRRSGEAQSYSPQIERPLTPLSPSIPTSLTSNAPNHIAKHDYNMLEATGRILDQETAREEAIKKTALLPSKLPSHSQSLPSLSSQPNERFSANHPSSSSAHISRTYLADDEWVSLTISSAGEPSNATFENDLCNNMGTNDNLMIINLTPEWIFFPGCLRSTPAARKKLKVVGPFIIQSFGIFANTLTNLSLDHVILAPNFTGPNHVGFAPTSDGAGEFAWENLWTNLQHLQVFSISSPLTSVSGSLPAELPIGMFSFSLSNYRGITGTIPDGLLGRLHNAVNYFPYFTLILENLSLIGEIPLVLFQGFSEAPGFEPDASFIFRCNGNQLSGPFPGFYISDFGFPRIEVDISANQLNGTMPLNHIFGDKAMQRQSTFFSFNASHNQLSGNLPNSIYYSPSTSAYLSHVSVILNDNQFSGSIPSSLLTYFTWNVSLPSSLTVNLQNNNLTGDIPWSLLLNTFVGGSSPLIDLAVDLSNNSFTGSIYSRFLWTESGNNLRSQESEKSETIETNFDSSPALFDHTSSQVPPVDITSFRLNSLKMNLRDNDLTGTIPVELLIHARAPSFTGPDAGRFLLDLSMNRLDGTIPSSLFAYLGDDASAAISFNVSSNRLSGPIPTLCKLFTAITSLDLSNNSLSGAIPSQWQTCPIIAVKVNDNPSINGSIPSSLLMSPSRIKSLEASNTRLTGPLPQVGSGLAVIRLSSTFIDFCAFKSTSAYSPTANFSGVCDFRSTSACNCQESYIQCSVSCSPSAPPQCSSPRPTPEFTCINGVWTASSTNVTTLTIPSNSGSIIITGNVTSSSIVFEGVIGTTIVIDGCANNLSTIVIQLTQEEVLKIGKSGSKSFTLLTQSNSSSSSGSCIGLDNVALATNIEDGCRTLSSKKVVSDDGKSLSALLSVDSSGCNRWWIILVSVVVVVVILGGVGIAVGYVLWNRHSRAKEMTALKNEKA